MKRSIANVIRLVGVSIAIYGMYYAWKLWNPMHPPDILAMSWYTWAWFSVRPLLLLMLASTCHHIANAVQGLPPTSSFYTWSDWKHRKDQI